MSLYNSENPNFKNGILCMLLLCFLPHLSAQTPPHDPSQSSVPRIKAPMIVIMVILVCIFFFLGFFSIYIRRCAERGLRPGAFNHSFSFGRLSRRSARGLDLELIESFPAFPYSAVKNLKIGKSTLECAVCLNEFEDDEMLRLIPHCNHVFHPECIDTWLSTHTSCPVCRADLLKPNEDTTCENPSTDLETRPETRINVEESVEADHTSLAVQAAAELNRPLPRSRSPRWKFSGLLPRSHSTGHSLIPPAGNSERFTLRLPHEVRKELIRSGSSVLVALPTAASSRRGFRRTRSGGGGRYERMEQGGGPTVTPPLFTRSGSAPSKKSTNNDPVVGPSPNELGSTLTPLLFTRSGSGRSSGSTSSDQALGQPTKRKRADGWGSTLTPSLFPRSVSVRFPKPAGSDQVVAVDSTPKRLVKSVTSPNIRLLAGEEETGGEGSEQLRQ